MFIPALTGLRAFAAIAVVLFHYTGGLDGDGLDVFLITPIIKRGYLGVDLFFILSGFIIHHVYRDKFRQNVTPSLYLDFIRSRFARIYPVHFLTLAVMVAFFIVGTLFLHRAPQDPTAFTIPSILASLFLLQGWLNIPSPNIPAWSVSAEWFAYLLYPFVRSNTAKLSTPSHIAIIIFALGVVEFVGNNHPLLRICPEFTIGMTAYDLNLKFGLAQRFNRYFGCFVSALIVASTYLVATEHLALYAALFALLICALANDQDKLGRILSLPVLTYFGEISYSTYMVHVPVWTFLKNIARLDHVSVSLPLFITVTLLLALAVSAVTFHFVELPARRAIRVSRRPIAEA